MAKTNDSSSNNHHSLPVLILAMVFGGIAGFGGGYLASDNNRVGNDRQSIQQAAQNEASLITGIAKDVGESVVSINVESTSNRQTFFGTESITQESAGTGFVISSEGIIVTNRHVVPKGIEKVSITLSDGTELEDVSIIGRTSANDPLDIAFLKINDKKGKNLKAARLGDSTKVEVGQRVVAIGNALGQFQNTVTSGIISGYGRSIQAQDEAGLDTLQNLFQTDASINEGNSGGPLVNMNGEVVGINTAVAAGGAENIGFAIPISDAQGLIRSVLEEGKLLRPFLGVRYVGLTDDSAAELEISTKRGAYINGLNGQSPIVEGSAAQKAGLKEKDIITKVNGTDINEKNSLASVLGRLKVGDKVNLTVVRNGETLTVEATLESAPTD
jgi:serine protease Do